MSRKRPKPSPKRAKSKRKPRQGRVGCRACAAALAGERRAEPEESEEVGKEVEQEQEVEKKGWLSRLRAGLAKSTKRVTESITGLFTKKKLDQQTLDDLEDALIQADLGVSVAARLVAKLGKERFGKEVTDEEVRAAFADDIAEILAAGRRAARHRCRRASRTSCWWWA